MNVKTPAAKPLGRHSMVAFGNDSRYTADPSPDRVSLLHKGGYPIWAAGAVIPSWKSFPSSSGQLPVPVALNARSPTLFAHYYTRFFSKSKE